MADWGPTLCVARIVRASIRQLDQQPCSWRLLPVYSGQPAPSEFDGKFRHVVLEMTKVVQTLSQCASSSPGPKWLFIDEPARAKMRNPFHRFGFGLLKMPYGVLLTRQLPRRLHAFVLRFAPLIGRKVIRCFQDHVPGPGEVIRQRVSYLGVHQLAPLSASREQRLNALGLDEAVNMISKGIPARKLHRCLPSQANGGFAPFVLLFLAIP